MVKAAAEKGLIDERAAVPRNHDLAQARGADFIVSYWALDLMEWLKS
jgi:delta-aminolevulinic acid dehydratase/porphobilinogen synthase